MSVPREHRSEEIRKAGRRLSALAATDGVPALDVPGTRAVEAWFLGPKAENAAEFERLLLEALRDHVFWRRNFHPGDPSHITQEIKQSSEYRAAIGSLEEDLRSLLAFLKKSVPFFSMRYQGHMNWDLTMPAILGYFAAMLYNPNNVAFEGSTATTILELLVGDDLCRMLGYTIPDEAEIERGAIRPWGHITCDGTVANIEAIWAARNLKLFPLALQGALTEDALEAARGLEVTSSAGSSVRIADGDSWSLLNLPADAVLDLPARLTREYGIPREAVTDALAKHALQSLGIQEAARRYGLEQSPVFLVPGTKHYSFPKAAALLGIGATNMLDVAVDLDARMDVGRLREMLDDCLARRQPVLAVVAVMGSTEESAVDPLSDVVALREEYGARGLEFLVHADAAWGGYHASTIRDDFDMPEPMLAVAPPTVGLGPYAAEQFRALERTDSITVDPHKAGYVPYPAGALCYRNSAMRDLVTFSAPVVFHGEAEPTVGIYGVEGSKPGAAAASVYLSHRTIRPTRSGYGRILGEALFSSKKLYVRLLCMAGPEDPFVVVPLPRLPSERSGATEDELSFIRERIDRRTNEELLADREAMGLMVQLGADQNILAYALNFRTSSGEPNRELALANRLNRAIYDILSIDPGDDIYGYDLIVSTTDLDAENYGSEFIDDYKRRLGVGGSDGSRITVLRSVVMDPWITETTQGSFLDVIEGELRRAANTAIEAVDPSGVRGY